jgi:hypothetical protein
MGSAQHPVSSKGTLFSGYRRNPSAGHWWVHLGLEMVVPSPDKGSAGRVWLSTTRSRGALVNHNASQAASQDPLI